MVAFHRTYKRLGVEKGDELRVTGVDHDAGTVNLAGKNGEVVSWLPDKLAGRTGGVEVYRTDAMELREGDRIRWTRNDSWLGLVNSQTAEVAGVKAGAVKFKLEDGRRLDMRVGDPQLRHIDRAWASTVHAFQGRTVDTVIAAMEAANHPHLTTQENPLRGNQPRAGHGRTREPITRQRSGNSSKRDVTGERIAALEVVEPGTGKRPGGRAGRGQKRQPGRRFFYVARD